MMEGDVRFSLEFDVNEEKFLLKLKGRSWGDNYSHDILDKKNFNLMLGLLMSSKSVRIINSNNTQLLKFSLSGSREAITDFTSCISG